MGQEKKKSLCGFTLLSRWQGCLLAHILLYWEEKEVIQIRAYRTNHSRKGSLL